MSVTYCSGCGKKHEYNFAKPNFCSSCGESFGSVQSKSVNKHNSTQNDDDEEDFDDDDGSFTNASYVPSIRKIQVDIENDSQYNTFNLGSIVSNDSNVASNTFSPQRRNRSTSLEDFKQNKK